MKNILILSYYFYPDNTPRAFRAFELAREFSKRNYKVKIITRNYDYNYDDIMNKYNIEVIQIQSKIGNNNLQNNLQKISTSLDIKKYIKSKIDYFMFGFNTKKYEKSLVNQLKRETIVYDILISVGLPYITHSAVSKVLKIKQICKVSFADYGDPFSKNPQVKKAFYFKYIEKKAMKYFNYITIPTEKSIEYYKGIKDYKDIKIIPQGFCFDDIKLAKYKKNDTITFMYAGLFYKDVRNPEKFLKRLLELDSNIDYKFIIYTDRFNQDSYSCIKKYIELLPDKLEVRDAIPREECLYELSKADFLINFSNYNSNQLPSKLIDYGLCQRPVLNIDNNNLDHNMKEFQKYINYDFTSFHPLNIHPYNIVTIVNLYEYYASIR